MTKKTKQPLVVDLFCGPGGLSLGFSRAGFEIFLANDNDLSSVLTYRKNHPSLAKEKIVHSDIDDFIDKQADALRKTNISVVVGGPPCQGFSMANRQRLLNDPRNVLFKKFIHAIAITKPKIILMENVKGMLPVAPVVVDAFNAIGYVADYIVLNAKDYGIPQNRERLIYIGVRKDALPNPRQQLQQLFSDIERAKTAATVPIKDALWGLRRLSARQKKGDTSIESADSGFFEDQIFARSPANKYITAINRGKSPKRTYNHKARYNNPRDLEIYKLLPQGGRSDHQSIAHIMPYKTRSHIFKDKYFKLDPNKVSKTITSHMKFDCNMYIHPYEVRGLTPREAARIQSFPDDYIFEGPYSQWYNQIGNAVPPLLSEVIAKTLMKRLV